MRKYKIKSTGILDWKNDYQETCNTLKNGPVMHYKYINGVKVRIK